MLSKFWYVKPLTHSRQRRDNLRNPPDDLGRLNRNPTTRRRSLASRIRLSAGVREAAGNTERTPPDARARARTSRRSVEVRLDVGRVSFDFENDVCGEEESWTWGGYDL